MFRYLIVGKRMEKPTKHNITYRRKENDMSSKRISVHIRPHS